MDKILCTCIEDLPRGTIYGIPAAHNYFEIGPGCWFAKTSSISLSAAVILMRPSPSIASFELANIADKTSCIWVLSALIYEISLDKIVSTLTVGLVSFEKGAFSEGSSFRRYLNFQSRIRWERYPETAQR